MNETLDFSFDPVIIPVNLRRGEEVVSYELREMTAQARDKYLDRLKNRVIAGPDGVTRIKMFEGMQSDLVSQTLYKDGKLVPEKDIQQMPATVVHGLYQASRKLNRLNENEEEAKKADGEIKKE